MPVALQAVLLRLLDDWTRAPDRRRPATKVDVFLVSATNATLDKAIPEGRFRSDLLYRLNTLEVTPATTAGPQRLRHHRRSTCSAPSIRRARITPATIANLAARSWPGNIRELRNMLARFTLARRRPHRRSRPRGRDHPNRISNIADTTPHDIGFAAGYPARPYPGGICGNRQQWSAMPRGGSGVSRNMIYRALH